MARRMPVAVDLAVCCVPGSYPFGPNASRRRPSRALEYYGPHSALKYRAQLAGLPKFHPHLLRHTAASRWLAAGGSEGGLMAVAGWATRDMVDRYTRSTASERAAAEARGLNLGEL